MADKNSKQQAKAATAPAAAQTQPEAPKDNDVLYGSDNFPADVVIVDGVTVPLGDVVRRAFTDSTLTVADFNALEQRDRDALLDIAVDALRGEHRAAAAAAAEQAAAAAAAHEQAAREDAARGLRVVGPEGCTSASHDGVSYDADEDGIFTLPKHAADALRDHGFTPAK